MFKTRMQRANIYYNETRQMFEMTTPEFLQKSDESPSTRQKNWSAFLYKDKVHYVHNVFPLTITAPQDRNCTNHSSSLMPNCTEGPNKIGDTLYVDTVSVHRCSLDKISWSFGELRGGTPAILVNGEYLSFFHSRHAPFLISFFFGAYTFSSEPPFKLLKLSKVPIIREEWYNGAWYDRAYGYIPYPMGFVVKEIQNRTTILLSLSLQEKKGIFAQIDYNDLMASMVKVNC
jgi:hypothetical protein